MNILTIYLIGCILSFTAFIYHLIKRYNEITILELIIIIIMSFCSWITLFCLFLGFLVNLKILKKVIYRKDKN